MSPLVPCRKGAPRWLLPPMTTVGSGPLGRHETTVIMTRYESMGLDCRSRRCCGATPCGREIKSTILPSQALFCSWSVSRYLGSLVELSRPFAVVTPTLDGDVLGVLAGADTEFTSGDVRRLLSGRSQRGVANVLERLTEQGIVHRRAAGRVWLYRLNRHHLAAPQVVALARLREELVERLASEVDAWEEPPVIGALFGSGTGPNHGIHSDVDLLLVRPQGCDDEVWAAQLDRLAGDVTDWTGNDARLLVMTVEHVCSAGAREPVLRDVARTGVFFCGRRAWLHEALVASSR